MRFVVFKKAGESGRIAINADLATYVRSGPGNFVDVHFGDVKVAVEGTFDEVVNKLAGTEVERPVHDPSRVWMSMTRE